METYCVSWKKNTASKNTSMKRTKNIRLMLVSNCVICGKIKSRFLEIQEASGLLSKLGTRIPLRRILE